MALVINKFSVEGRKKKCDDTENRTRNLLITVVIFSVLSKCRSTSPDCLRGAAQ